MSKLFNVVAITVMMMGCSTYHPLPISKPSLEDYNKYKDTAATAIPVPSGVPESIKYAWTYGEFYRTQKDAIQKRVYNHSDASLFGAIFAMLGGAAKSPEAVVAGGAFSAGAEIAPGRYQLAVQAANFGKAEKASVCVFDELRKINTDDEVALVTYESLIGSKSERTIGDLTYRTFKIIHARLDTAQSSVTLVAPNLDKLQSALVKKNEKQTASSSTTDEANKLAASNKSLQGFADIPHDQIKTRAEKGDVLFKEITNKMEVCSELVSAS
ncbi:MAG: hypothetical protein K9K30_02150 [Burkholderiaceae bacterium]|nr:hypothetical protein [Sulfuritalea sp.]MCF8174017.1 hypothetical protein [Burkholderiaceae bacterium]MCF8184408.1 hypothetical protein [Polynucleobacter sp.]